jgi:hypothetical protein
VEDSCEHGTELSGSTKCCDILEYMSNWQLPKKASVPWNQAVSKYCGIFALGKNCEASKDSHY